MITVTSNADSGAGTLRAAIAAAALGETITFSIIGSIVLTTGELLLAQDVVITGPGSGSLNVSGNNSSRVFHVQSGIHTITGLTLSNGASTDGAALFNESTLIVSDLIIRDSAASNNGGGINNNSTLTATDLQIHDNTAAVSGAGIYNSGTYTDTGGIITTNVATGQGGGIWNSGTFSITDGIVSDNQSTGDSGGGFYNEGTIEFVECTLSSNLGITPGTCGANSFGSVYFTRSTVMNHITPAASVVWNSFGQIVVANSTMSGNSDGVALHNSAGFISASNSTITNNGTGLFSENSGVSEIYDTILAGNTASDYTGNTGDLISDGHNLFGTSTNPITPAAGDQFGLTFAALVIGPLQDNGGPTFTHALLPGSPAIDAGDDTSAPATDQRGLPRIVGSHIDIGAYESQTVICLNFTGELPSWISIAGNCLVVAPNTFRGATKSEANVKAQAALDAFVAAAQESGDLSCSPTPPPECIPPNLETAENDGTLNGLSPVSALRTSGGNHYCFNTTVDLVAGQSVAIWLDSNQFDAYLYLVDPLSAIVAQDDSSGFAPPGSVDNAGITYTALLTGTYSIQATTFSALETGNFRLVVSDGVEKTITGMESAWVLIYVAATKRIFVLRGFNTSGANRAVVSVIDSLTDTVIVDTNLNGVGGLAEACLFYNTTDLSVWCAGTASGSISQFYRVDATTGALLETFTVPGGLAAPNFFAAYVPATNKLYGNYSASTPFSVVGVFNCGTRAFAADIPLDISSTQIWLKFIPEINRVLVVDIDHVKYYLINPDDDTIVSFAVDIDAKGVFLGGKWYSKQRGSPRKIRVTDLLTGTVETEYGFGYNTNGFGYNPCRERLVLPPVNGGAPNTYMSVSLQTDMTATESVIPQQSVATGIITEWSDFVWNPDTSRIYFSLAGSGKIFILS